MRSIAVLTAAVLATVNSPANAEKLKLRCESPLVPSASSTLYIDEVNGRITQIWDASGYEDTSPATFQDGVWRWVGWRSQESDRAIDISLDRRSGEVFGQLLWGSSCHSGRFVVDMTRLPSTQTRHQLIYQHQPFLATRESCGPYMTYPNC